MKFNNDDIWDPLKRKGENMGETILYYAPENTAHVSLLKGVLVQMGIKIKNLTPARCEKKIGFLAGMEGFIDNPSHESSLNNGEESHKNTSSAGRSIISSEGQQASRVPIKDELLILCGFTDERLDELLAKLKKAGVPRTGLKAVVTETNAQWTVYELYGHLLEERRYMGQR